jgi:hypothetical protein
MALTVRPETAAHSYATTYRGTRFRSRLEARWAAFFDLIDWSWVYEPFDTEGWIPDFLVRGAFPFLVEVGPCITANEYVAKGEKARTAYPTTRVLRGEGDEGIWIDTPERWTLIAGVAPLYEEANWRAVAAGWWAIDGLGQTDSPGFWYRCDECGALGLDGADYGGYLRPCGHVIPIRATAGSPIFDLWATAGNRVQWRSR